MITFITTPTDLVAQVGTIASGTISDLAPYATLIIGVSLGLFILSWLIGSLRGKNTPQIEQDNDI